MVVKINKGHRLHVWGVKTLCWKTEKVNSHLFSGALSFPGEGECVEICESKAIKLFSKRFWHI